jgi:hypothetical protein
MSKPDSHNLNIQNYSLDELLGLFDMTSSITPEQLKTAKKRVLMLHPDKSKLGPEYFLFYKKAFDIVVQYYNHQHRQDVEVTAENTKYVPTAAPKSTTSQINKVIEGMGASGFQQKFNQLFEENMVKKTDAEKNSWFSNQAPVFDNIAASNTRQMGEILENIKQKNQGLVKYSGVTHMYSGGGNGSNFYEDVDEPDDSYVTSDPFSKLKYDDLRKVHKDQTVFSVSETDYQKVPKYSSVDHFVRERSNLGEPIDKSQAETMLANREREMQAKMMQRQHQSNLKTMQYEEKNKTVLSSFMYLGNGPSKLSNK